MPDCSDHFEFGSAGTIRPNSNGPEARKARRAIKVLGLDVPELVALRRQALHAMWDEIAAQLQRTQQRPDFAMVVRSLQARDAIGQFAPFATCLLQVVRTISRTR